MHAITKIYRSQCMPICLKSVYVKRFHCKRWNIIFQNVYNHLVKNKPQSPKNLALFVILSKHCAYFFKHQARHSHVNGL